VGVDGQVRLRAFHDDGDGDGAAAAEPPPAPPVIPPPAAPGASGGVRVAIVDASFDNLGALHGLGSAGAAVDGPYLVGLAAEEDLAALVPSRARAALSSAPGHGTTMAGILLAEVPGVRLGLFLIPSAAGAARPYLAPTDLAAAIAAAVETWRADVVLVAMSDGAWGTPRHLREVLRAASRSGRGGRGAAIFCSVGDPSRNHVRRHDSAALGADDLASQPWVQAVAACDLDGRWYRVYPGYGAGGATYNRFGPAVALAARGEPRRYSDRIAADDSSQASALAAAAAARVLAANPDLEIAELRSLLALTADAPPVVDGGRGLGAGCFDGRDRLGHSLKLGHGVVNPVAACLAASDPICLALIATREVPDPTPGAPARALALAEAWAAAVRAQAGGLDHDGAGADVRGGLGADYARARGLLARLFLRSLAFQEALCWLARHLRALCEAPGGEAGSWWSASQDHGALVERIRHAADMAAEALRREPSTAAREAAHWVTALERILDDGSGAAVASFVRAAFSGSAALASRVAPVRTGPLERSHQLGHTDDDRQRGQT
jgi:hypothetical protein